MGQSLEETDSVYSLINRYVGMEKRHWVEAGSLARQPSGWRRRCRVGPEQGSWAGRCGLAPGVWPLPNIPQVAGAHHEVPCDSFLSEVEPGW